MKRTFIVRGIATFIAFAAAFFTAAGAHAQTTRLRVSIIPIVDVAPLFAAMKQGYFAELGLEIDTTPIVGGAAGIPGAIAGVYDVVYTNIVSTLLAKNEGLDLRIVASGSPSGVTPPDTAGIIKRKADSFKTGADLTGKVIGVNARNNINWLFAAAWIKKTGGDPSKVQYREVPFPQMVDAVKTRQVDVAHAVEPFLANGLRDPAVDLLGWPFSTVLPGIRAAQWIVSAETANKRPEVVRRWMRGMRKGAEWLNANNGKDPFYALIAEYSKLEPARLKAMLLRDITVENDVPAMRALAGLMVEHGMMKQVFDPAAMVFDTPK
jgi:NitT/TauT family transport system substrate-binding protein